MSTKNYVLNFTDPTKSTITVPAGDSFGPYSNTRFTDIELLGMGHTFWGEKTNENILHMLENFASNEDLHSIDSVSVPDTFVVAGRDVTKSFIAASNIQIIGSNSNDGTYPVVSSTFDGTDTTIVITGTLNSTVPLGEAGEAGIPDKSSAFSPITAITGQLWYNQTAGKILVFNQTGSPLTAGIGDWKPLDSFTVSATAPSGASDGDLWWDTTITDGRNLYIFVLGAWTVVVPDHLPRDGSLPMIGDLDMNNNEIINVGISTGNTSALSRLEADGRYVNTSGDTMSGQLNMNADISMNSNRITSLADPINAADAVNLTYADTNYVNVTGDTMSGTLNMNSTINLNGNRIIAVGNATTGTDALNQNSADGRYVNTIGDTMTGRLTLSADPINNLHAATKQYVDNNSTAGINAIANPTQYSITPTTSTSAWSTISAGIPAGANFVMVVGQIYQIVYSTGTTSLKFYGRNPDGTSGSVSSRWIFVEAGQDWPNAGSTFNVSVGSIILGVSSVGTIELLVNKSTSGIIAPSASYRIVAWW